MARKLRLEFPGACYHVVNRGNYRRNIFAFARTKSAFVSCLFQACERCGWTLHAFVVMRNHYHLAVQTPMGNLVAGMQWLQATFANRFNRLRDERGHLFQGRYKALLVENGDPLALVCHYIHLNPVRAGILPVERLRAYQHSSYPLLWRPGDRPKFLHLQDALAGVGGLADNAEGWRHYADHLEWQVTDGPAGKSKAYVNLSRGWALGSADFKADLLQDQAIATEARAWETTGRHEVRELHWHGALAKGLAVVGRNPDDLLSSSRSAAWKLSLALWMKQHSHASNAWLARHLYLGNLTSVSTNLTRHRRQLTHSDPIWHKLTQTF